MLQEEDSNDVISHWELRELQPLGEHQQEQGGLLCQDVRGSRMSEDENSDDDQPLGITQTPTTWRAPTGARRTLVSGCRRMSDVGG